MADTDKTFDVSLVAPDGPVFEGEATHARRPGAAGEIGVLARHAPLVATLKAGSTRVHLGPQRDPRVRDRARGSSRSRGPGARARRRRRSTSRRSTTRAPRQQLETAQAELAKVEAGESARRPLAARAAHQARREPALGLRPHDRLTPRTGRRRSLAGGAGLRGELARVRARCPSGSGLQAYPLRPRTRARGRPHAARHRRASSRRPGSAAARPRRCGTGLSRVLASRPIPSGLPARAATRRSRQRQPSRRWCIAILHSES